MSCVRVTKIFVFVFISALPAKCQPTEQRPWEELNIRHLLNGSWNLQPHSVTHKKRSLINNGYQSDFTGHIDQRKVFVLQPGPDTHTAERWPSLSPEVECAGNAMTLTAHGKGYTNLLVEREGSSPVSLFHLPPHCDYNMRYTWKDLVLRVPYDGCYIIQENDSYVLPLLWWGRPVKISCPVISVPELLCSTHGMVLKVAVAGDGGHTLTAKVEDTRVPLVSPECAHPMGSPPGLVLVFAPYTSSCVTLKDGHSTIVVVIGGIEFTMSCPLRLHLIGHPSSPSPSPSSSSVLSKKPGPKEQPHTPPPPSHKPAPAPSPPTPPPPPPPAVPSAPIPDPAAVPGYPPPGPLLPLYPPIFPGFLPPGQLFPGFPPRTDHIAPSPPPAPTSPPPAPTPPAPTPPAPMWGYNPMMPHPYSYMGQMFPTHPYKQQNTPPSPALGPHSQIPSSPHVVPGHYPYAGQTFPAPGLPWFAPPPPLQPPGDPSSDPSKAGPHSPLPPWPLFYWTHAPSPPEPGPGSAHTTTTTVATQAPTTTVTMTTEDATTAPAAGSGSKHPVSPAVRPMLFYPPYQAPFPVPVCPPHSRLTCAGYPLPHPDLLTSTTTAAPQTTHPGQGLSLLTPPVIPPGGIKGQSSTALWDAEISGPPKVPSSPSSSSSSADPPRLSPSLSCAVDRLVVSLPTAHLDSIQLREAGDSWVSVASTQPHCHYEVTPALMGALFSSPLPACHSRQHDDRSILSLPLRFWDVVLGRYHHLDLLCQAPILPPTTTTAPTTPPTTVTVPVPVPSTTTEGAGQWTLVPPVPTDLPSPVPKPAVLCSAQHMAVAPPPGPVSALVIKDLNGNEVKMEDAPVHCGYKVSMGKSNQITITLPFNSCHMMVKGNEHTVVLSYQLWDGRQAQAQLSCPLPTPPSTPRCDVPSEQWVACAPGPVSAPQCHLLGCCHDPATGACYYPMDECTADGHFVFSVPSTILSPPLNPATLFAGGNLSCPPWRATPEYALFKIPLDGCGAHKFEVGQTVIYMVEILNTVQAVSLNYGTITRDSPVRVLVECRYLPGSVVSVGYLVKRPSLGPSIQAQGVFGVQLRIAEDHTYAAYYPQYHRPLGLLLGRPLHLEVRLLNPPDPEVVLLVHYCVAYPRSAHAAWVLIYDGCPNPLDPAPQVTPTPPLPDTPRQTRRFTVSTFQFLTNEDTKDTKDMEDTTDPSHSDEEIYFMCSTEICSPSDGPCVEGCFGGIEEY
ncbi:proline-rich protein 36 [Sardina pilchardus]|uniref:proline-rich protein 36 n=1 Tax=Sardina pilchardus TaxID=27697 RepID=UPI002E163F81